MTRRVGIIALLAILVLWLDIARASGAAPLRLHDVLAAVEAWHPTLEAATRGVAQASGKRLAARGAWDPVVEVEARHAPLGYYRNGQVDAKIRQASPLWGVSGYVGYRRSWGDLPVYKGQVETLSDGEVRVGVDVPLWKNGPIDERRAEIARSDAAGHAATCERAAVRLALGRDAAIAYWSWVAAGHVVDIQRELLTVAERRARGLRELVRSGSAPAIVATDNERLVLDRRGKLVVAERDFRVAAVALSLYLRDDRGRPWRVAADRLPASLVDPPALPLTSEAADVARALESRPELCRLEAERDAARVDGRLAENQMAPSVNLGGFVAKDLGSGPAPLAPLELAASITVEMPLLLRKARGRRDVAEAKVAEATAVLRRASDRIAAEVRGARIDLETARAELELAKRQLEVAKQLELAEREKFAQGASDLVIVNLREIAAAEAARLAVQALAATHKAHAEYVAATGSML